MTGCEICGEEGIPVWRHRALKTETRREVRWLCTACHPGLPASLVTDPKGENAIDGTETAA